MKERKIIGIDLGGTNLKIALLGRGFKIEDKQVFQTKKFTRKEELIGAIAGSVKKIIQDNNLSLKGILGLGLGLPGPIDFDRGLVHFFPNIPGWKEVNLRDILKNKINLPVFIDNDANVMALAEFKIGAARGAKNAVCLTLGTGVGAGLILEGRLFRGSNYAAGELGHMPINESGPKCNCGGMACLESYIGNNRILAQARNIFGKGITLEELSRLAHQGNSKALKIWRDAGKKLGLALTSVINLINPDCIVIGGGVANSGRVLFDAVRETVISRAMFVQAKGVKIFKAKLGSDAGMIGAGILVKEGI